MTAAKLKYHIVKTFSDALMYNDYSSNEERDVFNKSWSTIELRILVKCDIKWGYPIFDPIVALHSDFLTEYHKEMVHSLNLSEKALVYATKDPNLTGGASLWSLARRKMPETIDEESANNAVTMAMDIVLEQVEPFVETLTSPEGLIAFLRNENVKKAGRVWPISRKSEKIDHIARMIQFADRKM